ncbi:extracellular solute-binding protein [Treponema primitia]|uniref:extracellular solute-binding protein n=1 Tax=Treponema primitia TaxID=88058 RepID=UPI0002555483|nr:extracellular solute-binding protein [Treponema primitia]
MVTIKDVAKQAGVSIATVSCALSGKKNVSHKARIRIMEAIEKLNYVPNESARKLRMHTSRDIGVLLTSIDDTYHSEIFKGITSVIQGNNFSVNIGFSNNQPKVEIEILNDFVSRNFAGIILISCMSNDTQYFEKLLSHRIPVVFIERRPLNPDINFVGITNKKTMSYLTEQLYSQGYRDISLYCGSPGMSSESDCVGAFREFCQKKKVRAEDHINYTNMSKEDAFRVALVKLYDNPKPEAIIATSGNIAQGIQESAKVLGLSLEGSIIIAFSEETWMDTQYRSALGTSRPAFKLGAAGASLLLRHINEELPHESILLDDNCIKTGLSIPPFQPQEEPVEKGDIQELSLLMEDSPFTQAVKILSRKFRNDYGIALNIETESQSRLPERIIEDALSKDPRFDVYMFDMPWLNFLVQNNFLEDLTDFITEDRNFFNSILRENLKDSLYQNRYYSVPFIGGAQILFYRNDLFEDPLIGKDFYTKHGYKLQPPRTWAEFNAVASFFTREHNPNSPVEYGTSCPGIIAEEFCPEIYNRIWGFNGTMFSNKTLPCFNTENNRRAFKNLIELQPCTSRPILETSINNTLEDFSTGKTAMLVTYTSYASQIMNAINQQIYGKLGFTFVPRRTSIAVGWNLGLNIFSKKKDIALQFFKWLYRKDLNYYLTILDGQSTSVYPYENNELLKLYPWMQITLDNFKYARKRVAGSKKNFLTIPWNKIEDIIYFNTKRMFDRVPVEQCLSDIDYSLTQLMAVYGHFRRGN